MARRTIIVSDLTGKEIDERNAAQVVIRYSDARRGQVVLDVNADEVETSQARGRNRLGGDAGRRARRTASKSPENEKAATGHGLPSGRVSLSCRYFASEGSRSDDSPGWGAVSASSG